MEITEQQMREARERMEEERRGGYAVAARYDSPTECIAVELNTGVKVFFPVRLLEGLAGASPEELGDIEISPAGLGLHWPALDADLYVPGLMQGVFGTRKWMAAQLGSAGGKARTSAKATAARENGRKGGRPRQAAGSS